VNCAGYRRVRFDIDTSGSSGLTALRVQILNWNGGAGKYFHGAEHKFSQQELSQNPLPALKTEVRSTPTRRTPSSSPFTRNEERLRWLSRSSL
jgi:hypothetical protein